MQCSTLKSIAFWALVLSVQAIVPETVKNVHEKHVAHALAARRVPRVRVWEVDDGTQGADVQA